MVDYEISRARMVREQLIRRKITDENVLKAMGSVPRHYFVDQAFWPRAYSDHPLPIGNDQTISQPYIVALMTQELEIKEGAKILEIGTGSGYQSAVLAVLGCEVYSIERHPGLAEKAEKVLKKLAIPNVKIKIGDGCLGWEENAPYDGIIVTAGAPDIPEKLLDQLKKGGKMVIPVGDKITQRLIKISKDKKMIEKRDITLCTFVPLVGDGGWRNE